MHSVIPLLRFVPPAAMLLMGSAFTALSSTAKADDKPAKSYSLPGCDAATLMRVLPGTWNWKLQKNGKEGMTDILLSFDEYMNVVGTATITDGTLLVTPGQNRAPLKLIADTSTGLESPARGALLDLPFPGMKRVTARLLLRSVSEKKIECLDLSDTEKPPKVILVKTNDRRLSEIVGPGAPPAAPAPIAEVAPSKTTSPAAQPMVAQPGPYPQSAPPRRSVLSMFERLKAAQAGKPAEDKTAVEPAPQPVERRVPIPSAASRPVMSVFQRLKSDQANKTDDKKTADSAPARPSPPPTYVPPPPPKRPVMSLYQRLKLEQEQQKSAGEPPETGGSKKEDTGLTPPAKTKNP